MDLAEIWPPYGVCITEGDLELRIARESDAPELVDLVISGIHAPDRMPFLFPWTRRPADEAPAEYLRFMARTKAGCTPADWDLQFVVRLDGELVGTQGLTAKDFAVTRTAETGSWLALRHQGHGIGTRMRRAICTFAFDELGAREVTSHAFVDNPASLAVSRKVGYRPNGLTRVAREGEVAIEQALVLAPDDLVRAAPIRTTGAGALRSFLGLAES